MYSSEPSIFLKILRKILIEHGEKILFLSFIIVFFDLYLFRYIQNVGDYLSLFIIFILMYISFLSFRIKDDLKEMESFMQRREELRELEKVRIENDEIINLLKGMRSFKAYFNDSKYNEPRELRQIVNKLDFFLNEIRPLYKSNIKESNINISSNAITIPAAIYKSEKSLNSDKLLSVYREVSSEFSHSIKTPLASIELAIVNLNEKIYGLNQENKDKDENSEIFISLLENASISLDYIKGILKRGAGFFPGEPERFSIQSVIRKSIRITREATNNKAEVSLSLDNIPQIKYYRLNLLLSIIQILENAFESLGPNGKIEIAGSYNKLNGEVEILISNNGAPIPSKVQSKIFEPGFSTKGSSRGLGLSIAKRCLETVNGQVELVQSNNTRTCFKILFKPEEVYQIKEG
ncbi:MAG: Adaptive-response sensory-kinase SasA [Candidatus Methanoperedens nitroreducens]|uniref:Adaptive-response sensory-kinase SasA n=1 Tax=Candidatus Methanoperedens nitratireducens TaxID=1392998 RepID=A0A0N8KRC3_9EURY|nr:sensor histidine kinase [Candidatus Methanoperedens sp. BLZ2]KAB2944357.1 MAG: sensor histidine kinase [Candidatus Methanoperedens sp.]KPQ44538.1 MAG: Adaptive-response sensory-kinase SasA [Candidatus Methanoperedens sp. BLZ1]MBZ0175328.1 sensor histidine kinase [Candidatus Methanoperedens nitroreducens]MCX9079471.1 sensor histidine kinase [Candidatus Methanoperedens sp.]MCX9086146.1 sensor histidine kinase [Candidatus Methanoperedens sp.]